MRVSIDLETNGLIQECNKVHCLSLCDIDSDYNRLIIGHEEVEKFIENLVHYDEMKNWELVFHNGFGFDLKVIEKFFGYDLTKTHKIQDTFILSQLFYGDLKQRDYVAFKIPQAYIGSHSLAAWGHRVQCNKGEYSGGFEDYNNEMGSYCLQDSIVTKNVFLFLESVKHERIIKEDCIELEYSIAPILSRQQDYGVDFNKQAAEELYCKLLEEKIRIKQDLQLLFKPRWIDKGEVVPKVNRKVKNGNVFTYFIKGGVYNKIELQEYNPSSRKQTIDRLVKELGWTPSEFTDKGNPEFDEEIIESLPFKELEPLKNFFIIDKRLGQLSNGEKSWLNCVKENNRIYGSVLQSGTVTRRMSHFNPNLAQVPSNDKLFGKECRSLFKVPKGKIQIGFDADALEMRTMGGYLKGFDDGRFINTLLLGKKEDGTDMHTINSIAYKVDHLPQGRDCSKTAFYGSLYGCKNPKLGLILQSYGIISFDYVPDFTNQLKGLKKWSEEKKTGFTEKYLECLLVGKTARQYYGEKLPELPKLIEDVTNRWKIQGYLKSLDGSKLFPRSEHSVFNILNQSAGAIIMKKTLQIADYEMRNQFKPGRDYEFILNVHDEFQLEVIDNPIIIDIIKDILMGSIIKAGEYYNFPCPMSGNIKIGKNWSETH